MNLLNLQFIFKPTYWLMNYPYNKEVDKIINELLDKYEMTDLDSNRATVKLGNATIWVENRPYASGRLYNTELACYRPSRLTIKKVLERFNVLRNKVNMEIVEDYLRGLS